MAAIVGVVEMTAVAAAGMVASVALVEGCLAVLVCTNAMASNGRRRISYRRFDMGSELPEATQGSNHRKTQVPTCFDRAVLPALTSNRLLGSSRGLLQVQTLSKTCD